MCSAFNAFIGSNFDPIFSDTAVAPWAEHIAHIDLDTHQTQARAAIHEVVRNAAHPAPSQRVVLIQGRAGFGKTHAIVAELWNLSREGMVYPAIMQLSVMLAPEDISLWMLRATIDELGKTDFRDAQNRTPLKRLADGLWDHAQPGRREAYLRAREEGDDSRVLALARTAAPRIRAALLVHGIRQEHEPIIAGLLLAADDASYAFTNWLRGGTQEVRFGEYILPALTSEDDRRRALISIAALAAATSAPLLLVFDQIEAASRVSDHAHLAKLIASAVQLVEHNVVGTAVVISALQDTYKVVKGEHLEASFTDRIENGVSPVTLKPPTQGELNEIIDKRAAHLLQVSGLVADRNASKQMVPDWLLAGTETTMLRPVLQAVRDYRNACREAGRFLNEHEYKSGPTARPLETEDTDPQPATEEFEKLWQDAIDADVGAIANIPTAEKADLFLWLVENARKELPQVSALAIDSTTLEGTNPTRIFDLQFRDGDGVSFERWKIAIADAPNSQGQLRDQITNFLDNAHNALPALLRIGAPLPRIRDDGEPMNSTSYVRGSNGQPQPGAPLADLLEAGGRIAPTDQRDWIRLRLARQFFEQRRGANGFSEWRAQRRFLLNMAGIGVMTKLLQPKTAA